MMEVLHPGVQAQDFLSAFPPPESLLLPCETVRLFDYVVAAPRGDHLLVVDTDETRSLPDRGRVPSELISTDGVWDVVFSQKSHHEVLGGLGIAVPLKQKIEHKPMLVDGPPQPVANPVHCRAGLDQKPAGTPAGVPVTQASCEARAELDGPFAEGCVTDFHTALVQPCLDVSVAKREAVIEPIWACWIIVIGKRWR